ncbi:hypothetical protein [Peribacillus muralis]|uniref:hypothetical protein n=1 Tax=Peribacillus muralis TaxID=264697 RepID=UPI00070A6EEB|nr:hypothetical protein [Peribacillus muralis]
MIKSLVTGIGIFTMAGGITVSGLGDFMPNQATSFQSENKEESSYYGYQNLKSLALAWYDNGYTNLDNPKNIPVDKVNGLPIGLSKDDYVTFVVEKYGEKAGNSASQVTFLENDQESSKYYGYKDLKSLALAWYDNGYTNLDNPKNIPVDKVNGLPIGLSKDDYVTFVVEKYGEKTGNSASQVTFLTNDVESNKESSKYYGYKDLKSLALAWYDNGYTNLDNPKNIPVDKVNGLPIGLSKDDYVTFVVEKYGEKAGNSASQVTFLKN